VQLVQQTASHESASVLLGSKALSSKDTLGREDRKPFDAAYYLEALRSLQLEFGVAYSG